MNLQPPSVVISSNRIHRPTLARLHSKTLYQTTSPGALRLSAVSTAGDTELAVRERLIVKVKVLKRHRCENKPALMATKRYAFADIHLSLFR